MIKANSPTAPTKLLELDLGVQAKVRRAAEEVNGYDGPIDCLINNAGIMATPFALSVDGIESQFATNHIGHFLFTNLIMEKLLLVKGARVVNVSFSGHRRERFRHDDYNFQVSFHSSFAVTAPTRLTYLWNGAVYDRWKAYGQSKTANMLFSVALAQKFQDESLASFSLYPGRVPTNIAQYIGVAELQKMGR